MPLLFVDHNSKGDSAMHLRTWPATALALLATLGAALALASNALSAQPDGLRALDGEWIYVEDRTEGRTLEQLGPPMSSKFSMRIEEGAVVLNGHGSGHRNVRIALDGSITEVTEPKTISRYRGAWKDGTFEYEIEFVRGSDNAPTGLIRRKFRITTDGLLVRVALDPPAGYGIGGALPPSAGHRAARAGQGRDRRPGLAGRRVGRNEELGVVDRGALEPAAGRRDARRVAHGLRAARWARSSTCASSSATAGWSTSRSPAALRRPSSCSPS